jgi:hypothetical protein
MKYPYTYLILLFGDHGDSHLVRHYEGKKFESFDDHFDYFIMNNEECEVDYDFAHDIDFTQTTKLHDVENKFHESAEFAFINIFACVIGEEWISRINNPWSNGQLMDEGEWSTQIWNILNQIKSDQCLKVYEAINY